MGRLGYSSERQRLASHSGKIVVSIRFDPIINHLLGRAEIFLVRFFMAFSSMRPVDGQNFLPVGEIPFTSQIKIGF